MSNIRFTYQKMQDGNYEVLVRGSGGSSRSRWRDEPRRLALCTHEDDARCITEAMEAYEAAKAPEWKSIDKTEIIERLAAARWHDCQIYDLENNEIDEMIDWADADAHDRDQYLEMAEWFIHNIRALTVTPLPKPPKPLGGN